MVVASSASPTVPTPSVSFSSAQPTAPTAPAASFGAQSPTLSSQIAPPQHCLSVSSSAAYARHMSTLARIRVLPEDKCKRSLYANDQLIPVRVSQFLFNAAKPISGVLLMVLSGLFSHEHFKISSTLQSQLSSEECLRLDGRDNPHSGPVSNASLWLRGGLVRVDS